MHRSTDAPHARIAGTWEPRSGDVLLSRAPLQISRWMAWNAECPFSHAALMLDHDRFIEAVVPRVRIGRLSRLLATPRPPELLALYRPLDANGRPLDSWTARQLVRAARRWLGAPFALARMGPLAVQTLLRHKAGQTGWRIEDDEVGRVSCAELVYRVLRDVLDLELSPRRLRARPRPRLRPLDLWREWRAATRMPDATRPPPLHRRGDDAAPAAHEVITTDLCSSPRLALVGLRFDRRRAGHAG